jgi:hypothetical protein
MTIQNGNTSQCNIALLTGDGEVEKEKDSDQHKGDKIKLVSVVGHIGGVGNVRIRLFKWSCIEYK